MPNELSALQLDRIRKEYEAYGKITAIKLYRQFAHCTLVEAKDAVERLCLSSKGGLGPAEPCVLVITVGDYVANWNAALGELRIPFGRADIADEAQASITIRLERDER